MSLHIIFLLIAAFATFIVLPIALFWTFIDGMKRKASDRPSGGGGISSFVGGAMLEIDKLTRPAVEHQQAAQHQILKREDNADGE